MDPITPVEDLIPPPVEVNDANKVYGIAVACIVMCIVATAIVVIRLVNRHRLKIYGMDDYFIVPSTILYIGWTALAAYINLNAGVGKPLWEITLAEYSTWFKGIVATAWLYPVMSASIRISIILFYIRIFARNTTELVIRRTLYALILLQILYVVVFSILPGFLCRPFHYAWSPPERQQYCNDFFYNYLTIALYSVSLAFDAILLVLPIFPVFKLQLSLAKRLGVSVIFMLGAAASIAAAYKLGVFVDEMKYYVPTDPTFLQYQMSRFIPGQFSRYGTTFWIPSQVEPTVALIGSSLPALNNPLKSIFQQLSKWLSTLSSLGRSTSTTTQKRSMGFGSGPAVAVANRGNFRELNESETELRSMRW